jgi:hypothetical protein
LAYSPQHLEAQVGAATKQATATPDDQPVGKPFRLPSDGAYSRATDGQIIKRIDALVRDHWKEYEVTGGKPANESTWCRRVYLDVLGRTPTIAELESFLKDRDSNKKANLAKRLLSDEFSEEYARHSTVLWVNTLIGRAQRAGSFTNRQGMQKYLRESFLANKPYDQMVYELLTATGASRPGHPEFNGAVNFLGDKLEGAGITAASLGTARTSEIFMGVRLQCVQCHNHPFNNWKQNQYWELNAFFRQGVALRRFEGDRDPAFIELADQDYADERGDAKEAAVFYEGSDRVMRVAYPVFTDKDGKRTEISTSGYLEEVNRRKELAKLIVYSGYLPDAMVNATWARFLGYGFTKPVDDMGPHNLPANPKLLDEVSRNFRESGYNIKRLITWIVLSLPYSLDSRPTTPKDEPSQGIRPLFTRFYIRQLQPEEMYESLRSITEGPARTREAVVRRESDRDAWVANLVTAQLYVTENKESTSFDGSIPQMLMMFNGELTRQATSTDTDSFLHRLAGDSKLRDLEKVDRLFLAALSRKSANKEQAAIGELWHTRGRSQSEVLRDVWWSLINSNEFILNH